jgi:hypothetical protein
MEAQAVEAVEEQGEQGQEGVVEVEVVVDAAVLLVVGLPYPNIRLLSISANALPKYLLRP